MKPVAPMELSPCHSPSRQIEGSDVYASLPLTVPSDPEVVPRGVMRSDFLANFLNNHKIAGAVTLIAHENEIVHFATAGYANLQSQQLMKRDDIFWVASMTKPITAAAIMALVDEGKLALDDSVGKWLPEFGHGSSIEEKTNGQAV